MNISIYNQKGEEAGKMDLPDEIFNVRMNSDLVHQVVMAQMANQRQVLAHTKTRGEVRGGGKKPWKQKGTGRARAGSIRSPLWKGGGVTFGPRNDRNFTKKINKKMKQKALLMALSSKVKDNEMIVLDKFELGKAKTKEIANLLDKLSLKKSILISLPKRDDSIYRASRNIPEIKMTLANSLNAVELLKYKYLLMPKEAIEVIEKTYNK